MKKFLSILLAAMLVLGMVGTAFAADTTITAPNNGHTYQAFQVFTADYSDDILSNVKWGSNAASGYTPGEKVSDELLAELANLATAGETAKRDAVLKLVDLTGTPAAGLNADKLTESVPTGYYVIVDKDNTVPDHESYTLALVQIAGAVTISPKSAVPEFEKKVKDKNDTKNAAEAYETGWQDSADYDIGDHVPFLLKGTVASNYDYYKVYQFNFHDTLESGKMKFDGASSVVVKVDDQVITNGYTVETKGENEFSVKFADLKKITGVHQGSVITVEYTAELLSGANVGKTGNLNTAYLEFSNNPNDDQGGDTGKTPEDTVIVFTYKVVVNKVDKDNKPLSGADFALSKQLADGSWKQLTLAKNEDGTVFSFTGLDDGDYKIEETQTPAGKNSIASPIFFTVAANHVTIKDDLSTTNRDTVLTSLTGTTSNLTTGTYTFAYDETNGALTTDVVNLSGATLPETGGIGTTIFYLLGSIMFIGAAMTLVVRRRAEADEV